MILEQLIMKINGSAEIRNTRGVKKKKTIDYSKVLEKICDL